VSRPVEFHRHDVMGEILLEDELAERTPVRADGIPFFDEERIPESLVPLLRRRAVARVYREVGEVIPAEDLDPAVGIGPRQVYGGRALGPSVTGRNQDRKSGEYAGRGSGTFQKAGLHACSPRSGSGPLRMPIDMAWSIRAPEKGAA